MKVLKVADQPALLLKGRNRILVVADLHIGIGGYVDPEIVNSVIDLYEYCMADELVVVGDFKHSIAARWREVKEFLRLEKEVELTFVKGNHDGGLKGTMELEFGKLCLLHGHVKPKTECKRLIIGHVHPAVYIEHGAGGIKERVWIEGKVEIVGKKRELTILPAFNEVCASTALNLERAPGILKNVDLKSMKAIMLDGTYLGELALF
jgi:putative SbcD/Mre11-related phosphoesterase